jgi:aquaporin Z
MTALDRTPAKAKIVRALCEHWPEYAMEAALLGFYMIAAGVFAVLLRSPVSPLRKWIASPLLSRALYGCAMGATSTALVYSPWGRQSGAHANSAITLTYWRLGKVSTIDALFYAIAQLAGGVSGVLFTWVLMGDSFRLPPVSFVITKPGPQGVWWALAAEFLISFLMMSTILAVTNRATLAKYGGIITGCLVALFLAFEAPLSGMSMNPARTFSSALPGWLWQGAWAYFVGPVVGMLLAVEVRRRLLHAPMRACAKLYHDEHTRCIFCGHEPA